MSVNFKGSNASITEPKETIAEKLKTYSNRLRQIGTFIGGRSLRLLGPDDLSELKKQATEFLLLTACDNTAIRGFGPSYASALLAAYFPQSLPVLDRRVLRTAEIKFEEDKAAWQAWRSWPDSVYSGSCAA